MFLTANFDDIDSKKKLKMKISPNLTVTNILGMYESFIAA